MPPQYVKPYVKPSKTGRANAAAIFEAVQRPTMRFVAVKTEDQQGMLVIHRVRDTLVAQRTQLINALRTRVWTQSQPEGVDCGDGDGVEEVRASLS